MRKWDDAAALWLLEKAHKTTIHEDRSKLEWLAAHFGGLPLSAIDRETVMRIASLRAAEASHATANRLLALIRAVLRRSANVWRWIDRPPHIELFPERKRRVRWLTPDQARTLLDHLPTHQRDLALFALATGLRQGNVIALQWDQIDLSRSQLWIHADQAKGRQAISVPLNQTALDALGRQVGRHPIHVWTYRGRPIRWANTKAWRKALKRAGIHDFRWHDLRHTWASWHVQHGTPLYVVQDLGGWQTEAMVRRYAHLAPSQYAAYARAVDPLAHG